MPPPCTRTDSPTNRLARKYVAAKSAPNPANTKSARLMVRTPPEGAYDIGPLLAVRIPAEGDSRSLRKEGPRENVRILAFCVLFIGQGKCFALCLWRRFCYQGEYATDGP